MSCRKKKRERANPAFGKDSTNPKDSLTLGTVPKTAGGTLPRKGETEKGSGGEVPKSLRNKHFLSEKKSLEKQSVKGALSQETGKGKS